MIETANSAAVSLDRFAVVTRHVETPRPAGPRGKLVLSSLHGGETRLAARTASVKFVLEGEEEYDIDGRRVRVDRGQFLLLEPGDDCVCRIRRREPTLGMCVYLPVSAFEADFSGGRALTLPAGAEGLGEFMTAQAARLWRDPTQGESCAEAVVGAVARLANVARREAEMRMAQLTAAKASTRRDLLQRLERARAFLHETTDRPVSQSQLARIAGLSQFHLARQFRDAFGHSPGAYHRRVRLEAASTLIDEGLTLDAAAERTGYSDGSALGHALRRVRD
jgi:AraC-like DNA-binding protein